MRVAVFSSYVTTQVQLPLQIPLITTELFPAGPGTDSESSSAQFCWNESPFQMVPTGLQDKINLPPVELNALKVPPHHLCSCLADFHHYNYYYYCCCYYHYCCCWKGKRTTTTKRQRNGTSPQPYPALCFQKLSGPQEPLFWGS